jgi:hypothetical protein
LTLSQSFDSAEPIWRAEAFRQDALAAELDQVERAEGCDVTARVAADELENSQALAVADPDRKRRAL